MKVEDNHRLMALRLGLHEMGHYAVARALGFRTGGIWIQVTPDSGNGVAAILPEKLCSLSDVQAYMERRVLVLFAGIIAEALEYNSPQPFVSRQKAMSLIEQRGRNGDTDQAKIKEILLMLFNLLNLSAGVADDETFQTQVNEMYNNFFERAVNLVEDNAETICHFAIFFTKSLKVLPTKITLNAEELELSPKIKSIRSVTA